MCVSINSQLALRPSSLGRQVVTNLPLNLINIVVFNLQAELVKWLMAHHANDRPNVEDIYNSVTFKQLKENVMETIPKL